MTLRRSDVQSDSIQKIKFGLIQFNKIFIQLGSQGIEHHYYRDSDLDLDLD